ncbi:HEPN domain-containing protein [Dyadobacter aurulentus]|uniref:HEPN domain-containing protein n=1 Tax=Dyadobacter sp. UC 10 TaxID=2605428 RepID=UPI0011F38727|nr:HEPN domain-containing protein [Dyadobacter sp. UC 10]KAA0989868.1 HEPN domain-containing protein [Dyadobacter sp. UC 10]
MTGATLPKILIKVQECVKSSKDSFDEGHFEACINRAYYAIFHSVQMLLFIQHVHAKTHVGAHNKFRELYIKSGLLDSLLSDRLQRSFVKRQFGDYDYEEVTEEQALESLDDAAQFVKSTLQFLKENNHL